MSRHRTVLSAYVVLGAYAVWAQATLLREMHVLVFGSELSWGLVLAFWLAGVAAGAMAAGRLIDRSGRPWLVFAVAGLAMPPALLGEVVLLRVARSLVDVGPGEYVGPGMTVLLAAIATVPVSVWVGLAFPAASALIARGPDPSHEKARAVGWVYLAESAGALVGGAAFSFLLVGRVGAVPLALGGGAVLALFIQLLVVHDAGSGWARFIPLGLAVTMGILITEGVARRLDEASVRWRWASFAETLELVQSRDTRYQNAALGRLGEQFSLYANGLVDATWPNHADLAIDAHLAACQHPAPKQILVLGGGAEGMLKELACHEPDRLDYVTLDRALLAMVREHLDAPDRNALDALDGMGQVHFADARRFVKRAAARGQRYDLVILAAPEPASTLEARLYTQEFFGELSRAMADDGVLVFTLSTPVGYWSEEPAAYAGSIVTPLKRVFPDVLLTFGTPMHCFAAKHDGVLVESGEALARRYWDRGVEPHYFDPDWFLGASDLLDREKRAAVRRALADQPPEFINTDERPAAALYHVRYWLQQSAAAHATPDAPAEHRADVLGALLRLRFDWAMLGVVAVTMLAAVSGLVRGRRGIRRTALLWSVGTTGFASMALVMVLLHTFQTLYGYVYSMVGLVIGVFMFGLVIGSLVMNRRLGRASRDPSRGPGLRTVVALDLALTVFAAGLVLGLALLRRSAADWPVQVTTFALVAVAGILGGLVFPLAAAVALKERGATTGRAAGAIDAADHLGACVGALATGTVLVPILGVSGACLVVVAIKALSAVQVGVASTIGQRASAAPSPSA